LQDAYTKAGKLDEAVAIRDRIRGLKLAREKAQSQLTAAKERAKNLLVNGSFEDGPETPMDGVHVLRFEQGSTAMKGWVVTRSCIPRVDHTYWKAADGKISVGFTPNPGAIAQSFKTKKGQRYRVSFSLAGDPGGGPRERKLAVNAAGKSAEFAFDMTGKTRTEMGWLRKSWEFTADADHTTLEFVGLTEGDNGPALDDVVVVPVKE
jgi:choice-of-anchor C domain-containing protein